MIRLIQFLWSGCWHKWAIHSECALVRGEFVRGTAYHLKCERCGEMTFRRSI